MSRMEDSITDGEREDDHYVRPAEPEFDPELHKTEGNEMSNKELAASMIEAENRDALQAAKTPEEKFRIAFKGAKDHWMFVDEEDQYVGGIGAALISMSEEQRTEVSVELKAMRALNSMLSGVPVDISAVEIPDNVIGIQKLWHEINA